MYNKLSPLVRNEDFSWLELNDNISTQLTRNE
jgi:hypothetical protein